MKDLYDLFIQELKEALDCETQALREFPELIKAATSHQLKEALQFHCEETKKQIQRLKEISTLLNENLQGRECDGIRGILKEGHKNIQMDYSSSVKDAAIIAVIQRFKHYEMALYGVLIPFAKHLKLDQIGHLLRETIKEEGNFDKKLTEIAEGGAHLIGINEKASKRKSA